MTLFRKHKYGMSANGSKLEKAVGAELALKQKAGELKDVREQVRIQVCCQDGDCPGDKKIVSIVDFSAYDVDASATIYIEAKGFETPEWRLKRRLWKHNGPGRLLVYKGSYKKFYLDEEINPEEAA